MQITRLTPDVQPPPPVCVIELNEAEVLRLRRILFHTESVERFGPIGEGGSSLYGMLSRQGFNATNWAPAPPKYVV